MFDHLRDIDSNRSEIQNCHMSHQIEIEFACSIRYSLFKCELTASHVGGCNRCHRAEFNQFTPSKGWGEKMSEMGNRKKVGGGGLQKKKRCNAFRISLQIDIGSSIPKPITLPNHGK